MGIAAAANVELREKTVEQLDVPCDSVVDRWFVGAPEPEQVDGDHAMRGG